MASSGFNLFVLGPNGIGKHTVVQRFLEERAAEEAVPPDYCYVHNFEEPNRPLREHPAEHRRHRRGAAHGHPRHLRKRRVPEPHP
ncbi:MAG: Lon-like protease helical domain-containing protein [Thiohalorhabdaceae bacterium]